MAIQSPPGSRPDPHTDPHTGGRAGRRADQSSGTEAANRAPQISRPAPAASAPGVQELDYTCLHALILARICVQKGATRTDLGKDIAPFTTHKLSPAEWRTALDQALDVLKGEGLISEKGGRLHASADGIAATQDFLGTKGKLPHEWRVIADTRLTAKALGLERAPVKTLKALTRPDVLRAMIVTCGFGLKLKGTPTPSQMRAALAVKALERAFGNQITSNLKGSAGLSARAARLLAGQLSTHPRDFGTDRRLLAALAAQIVGAAQTEITALHTGLFRLILAGRRVETLELAPKATAQAASGGGMPEQSARNKTPQNEPPSQKTATKKAGARALGARKTGAQPPAAKPGPAAAPYPAAALNDVTHEPQPPAIPTAAAHQSAAKAQSSPSLEAATSAPAAAKPNLEGFTKEVHRQAIRCAQGWSGDRKAFISHVWQSIRNSRPEWGLSAIEFKCMLLEAHHLGKVLLSYADLKDKSNIDDVKNSAIAYKSTVWHFVRVEE